MYIPVMKNRTVEVTVLQKLSTFNVFGENIIPMVEMVQERIRSNSKHLFLTELTDLLREHPDMKVMLDFYKSTRLRNTSDAIREYISRVIRQPDFSLDELNKLDPEIRHQVIPVISYLPENISLPQLLHEIEFCHKNFPSIAYRFKPYEFPKIFDALLDTIQCNDYVILDVGSASYTSPVFKGYYKLILDNRKIKHYQSIAINAHRPENLTNVSMVDREPIGEIDNGLKELYKTSYMCRFDGFGDYATISAALPTTGGAISPAGIYYSDENNFFIAYKGRKQLLSEFPDYIAPSIVESTYWKEYTAEHHQKCPGCVEIQKIVDGESSGKNQALWKMIAMLHYIYTLYEIGA